MPMRPGYLHIDVKYLLQMADEDLRRYLFVAIDPATRWAFVRIYLAKTAANARRFLRDLERAASMKIAAAIEGGIIGAKTQRIGGGGGGATRVPARLRGGEIKIETSLVMCGGLVGLCC